MTVVYKWQNNQHDLAIQYYIDAGPLQTIQVKHIPQPRKDLNILPSPFRSLMANTKKIFKTKQIPLPLQN